MIGVDIANSDQHTNPVEHVTYHVRPYDEPMVTGGKDYTRDLRRYHLAFQPILSSREPMDANSISDPSHLPPHEYQSQMASLTGAGRTRITMYNVVQLNYLLHKWTLEGFIDPANNQERRPIAGAPPLNTIITPKWVKRNFRYLGEIFTEDTEKSSPNGERAMVVTAQADEFLPNVFGRYVYGHCHLWLMIRRVPVHSSQFYLPYSGTDGPFGEYLGNKDAAKNEIKYVTRIIGAWTTTNVVPYKVPESISGQYGDDSGYGSLLYKCVDNDGNCIEETGEAIYVGMVTKNLDSNKEIHRDCMVDIDVYDASHPHLEVSLYTI